MKIAVDPELREIIEVPHYRPALSIILPVDPDISLKEELAHTLKITADKAELALQELYPKEQSELVSQKLHALIDELEIPVKKKGIALFVSPLFKKVYYLDGPVTEKLIIDESFEIRDLLYNAKQEVQFIVVMVSGNGSKVFFGDRTILKPISTDIPKTTSAYATDAPERVSNFSDVSEYKQSIFDKFLHHVDETLAKLMQEYRLPVLIIGAEKTLGQFKKMSKLNGKVMAYIEGNYEKLTTTALMEVIHPFITAWQVNQQNELLKRLDEAAGQRRLTAGVRQVWQQVHKGKGKLLVVEKSYRFAAQHGPEPDIIDPAIRAYDHFAYIRDAVDDVIEKIILSGGEVEFTEDGMLEQYDRIALINYYA